MLLLSAGLSQRSKNVIRPVIDCAAPAGFLSPYSGHYPLSLDSPVRSSRRAGAALAVPASGGMLERGMAVR